jgi:RNA polymerase sigma-70 factor (ECF subfamily)
MTGRAIEESFRTLFEPHRRSITLHCYRMLGSLQDAEEVVQEIMFRAWQRQDELRSSGATRAWLYKIATNGCLDLLKTRRRRALPHLVASSPNTETRLGPPAEERLWVEPAPDALLEAADNAAERPDARVSMRESIGLAFVTALQSLPPKQRAVLILVDVLGWRPHETAELLETTLVSVNSLLQRARKCVEARRNDDVAPEAPSFEDAALLRRYITTWEGGDLDAFTALLADDVRLSMPPQFEWFAGRDAVRRFLASILPAEAREFRLVPLAANGGLAVAVYARPMTRDVEYEAAAINVIAVRGGLIAEMIRFASPKLFPLFGLPAHLPSDDPGNRASGAYLAPVEADEDSTDGARTRLQDTQPLEPSRAPPSRRHGD